MAEASLVLVMGKSFCILTLCFKRVLRISSEPKEKALQKVALQGQM